MTKMLRTLILFTFIGYSLTYGTRSAAQVVTQGSSNLYIGFGQPNIPKLLVGGLWEGGSGASGFGPWTVTYQYSPKKKIAVGVQIGYVSGTSGPITWQDPNSFGGTNTYSYTFSMSIFTALCKFDYHYLKSKTFDLYSGVAAGYGFARISFSGIDNPDGATVAGGGFIYSVDGIGMRWMFVPNFGVFTEFGYGAMGIVTFGLSAKFGGKKDWWNDVD